jgi:hypothetical protein
MPRRADAPSNLRSLEARIGNLAAQEGRPVRRIQRAIANTVVGQMLPPGVVKGGTAMKLRVGEAASRFTPDLDVSRSATTTINDYLDELAALLDSGWGGFSGTVEELEAAQPQGVPDEYVMQPFLIRVGYRGRHWLTVPFELGRDEIGSTEHHDRRLADDIVEIFHALGLDTPEPIPVLALEHQIAQKLHACTSSLTPSHGETTSSLAPLTGQRNDAGTAAPPENARSREERSTRDVISSGAPSALSVLGG